MGRRPGLPVIYKRPDSEDYWCRFTANKKRYRFSTGLRDPREAQEAAEKLYAEALLGRNPKTTRRIGHAAATALDLLSAEYCDWIRANGRAETYAIKQEGHFRAHFLVRWSRISQITTQSIEQYKVERIAEIRKFRKDLGKDVGEGAGTVTVYKELVTLSRFLRWAWKVKGAISEVPAFDRVKPVSDYVPPNLTRDDIDALLAKLPDRFSHPKRCPVRELCTVQWAQGMRPGEVYRLRWMDIDLRARIITIPQSSDKARQKGGRPIPMDPFSYRVLSQMAKIAHLPTGLIFGERNFRASLRKAVKAARLPHLTPHHFRHARLTELCGTTRDTAAVQYLAGHKSMVTTDRYVQSRVERAKAVLKQAAKRGK